MENLLESISLENQNNLNILENQVEQKLDNQNSDECQYNSLTEENLVDSSDQISFEDLGLDEITLKAIEKKGFKVPSPIQV